MVCGIGHRCKAGFPTVVTQRVHWLENADQMCIDDGPVLSRTSGAARAHDY